LDERLLAWLADCSGDPYTFVMGAFPWSEAGGPLERFRGPEAWQTSILTKVRDGLQLNQAIQLATSSGHGVGKSCCVAWLIIWSMATMPHTRGVITANTEPQLKSKTWAELGKWFGMFIAKHEFQLTATALFNKAHERTWRIDMIPWSRERPEAFAGLHNKGRRILVIFDEASAIDDIIWETTEGALTDSDTQIIWAVFGNPTRSTGRFRECFEGGMFADTWRTTHVDSREVSITNKDQINRWIKAYGEDSDFARIRIRGVFPRVGEMEFFSGADLDAAMSREIVEERSAPLALGVDVARYGQNFSVIFPRKGRDARTLPRQRYQGINTVQLAERVFTANSSYHADGIFIDGGGVGGGVVDNVRHMQLHCYDVQFGAKNHLYGIDEGNPGEKYANLRAGIYGALRSWLRTGALPFDNELRRQFVGITYTLNQRDEILLTSKEVMMREGKESPDDVDALATTFAYPIANHARAGGDFPIRPAVETEYDPYAHMSKEFQQDAA
jgi:hypothetical protein